MSANELSPSLANVCRVKGRWRLEDDKRRPKLVFWRETKDCEGKTGWVVAVGKR